MGEIEVFRNEWGKYELWFKGEWIGQFSNEEDAWKAADNLPDEDEEPRDADA